MPTEGTGFLDNWARHFVEDMDEQWVQARDIQLIIDIPGEEACEYVEALLEQSA